MNYIGSKRSLLPSIRPFLAALAEDIPQPRLLDIFSGTGIVSQLGRYLGFSVVANDLQEYARVTAQALLTDPLALDMVTAPATNRARLGLDEAEPIWVLEPLFSSLESLIAPSDHPFVEAYAEGGTAGRLYLSRQNGLRVAAARDEIETMVRRGDISPLERDILVACLLEGIDRVANTASVYGAYLKKVKKSAQAEFRFAYPRLVSSDAAGEAFRGDANRAVRELAAQGRYFDIMYVDPPYNSRLYASNYHLLETLARWDIEAFAPRGKTGLRPSEEGASDYCSKKGVRAAVLDLLTQAPAGCVLFSYSDEGLLPHDDLVEVMVEAGFASPETTKVGYKRFRADNDSDTRVYSGDEVTEYLILASRR